MKRAGKTRRLILVVWKDAKGGDLSGWRPISSMGRLKPETITSVGWLVKEDKEAIVVCPHVAHDGEGDGEIAIPRDWVQRIADLHEAKP